MLPLPPPPVSGWTDLHARFVDGLMIVKARLPDGRERPFLLDSGYPATSVAPRLVPKGRATVRVRFRIGARDLALDAERDDPETGANPPSDIETVGVLGTDALRRFRLYVDYDRERAWADPDPKSVAPPPGESGTPADIPLTPTPDGYLAAPARLGTTGLRLVVDTGANVVALLKRRIPKAAVVASDRRVTDTTEGMVPKTYRLLRGLDLGGRPFPWIEVLEDPGDEGTPDAGKEADDGTVGPSVLAPRVLLDFRRRSLRLYGAEGRTGPTATLRRLLNELPLTVERDRILLDLADVAETPSPPRGPARLVSFADLGERRLLDALAGAPDRPAAERTLAHAYLAARRGARLVALAGGERVEIRVRP